MSFRITEPAADDVLVGLSQPILMTTADAVGSVDWSESINGGSPRTIATGAPSIVYTSSSAVQNADASGNAGADQVTISAIDNGGPTTVSRVLVLVAGIPRLAASVTAGPITETVPEIGEEPHPPDTPGGPADSSSPAASELLEESQAETPG